MTDAVVVSTRRTREKTLATATQSNRNLTEYAFRAADGWTSGRWTMSAVNLKRKNVCLFNARMQSSERWECGRSLVARGRYFMRSFLWRNGVCTYTQSSRVHSTRYSHAFSMFNDCKIFHRNGRCVRRGRRNHNNNNKSKNKIADLFVLNTQ